MGLYITLSVVYGKSSEDVLTCVKEYATQTNGGIEPLEEETGYYDFTIVSGNPSSCIVFPTFCSDDEKLSAFISKKLNTSVILCDIIDGDYWTYILYNNKGDVISLFSTNSRRQEITENERDNWKGDASLVAQSFGNINPENIGNYFSFSDDIYDIETRAYNDDEYAYGDDESRQLFDFIRKLGVPYPFNSTNSKTYLFWNDFNNKYEFDNYDDTGNEEVLLNTIKKPKTKPWWKFW